MKKVLFATTALIASAGMASADIGFSGSAAGGVYNDGTETSVYSSVDFDVTMTGETDNGLTFGASFDIQAGYEIDTGDFEVDGAEDGDANFGDVFISGNFGTLTIDREGVDNLYDDDFSHDISYSYTGGPLTFTLTAAAEDDAAENGVDGEAWSASAEYDASDSFPASFSLTLDDSGSWVVSVSYMPIAELEIGLEYDAPNGADEVSELSVAYDNGMFRADAAIASDDDWSIGAGVTVGAFSADASTDESEEWELTGSYDLGGGLSVIGGINYADFWYLGATMSF